MAQPKILIVKTSSLGDVVHMLPAVTDIHARFPNGQIDWVVEENFVDIPRWHNAVTQVFPVAIRRWRKSLLSKSTRQAIKDFKTQLASTSYDVIIDAQGLIKSALISRWAQGKRVGFDFAYAREPLASFAYQQRLAVGKNEHAIKRNRLLAAGSLEYAITDMPLDYGIQITPINPYQERFIMALHGTSRPDKEWSLGNWRYFLSTLQSTPLKVYMPWGNQRELDRATLLATEFPIVRVLPKSTLTELAQFIAGSCGVIGMDTGLMHIAAALGKSGVAIYPVTSAELTGAWRSTHIKGNLSTLTGESTHNARLVTETLLTNLGQ